MRAGVDLLHLDFSINVAVIQEVDVRQLYLFSNISEIRPNNSAVKSSAKAGLFYTHIALTSTL